MTVVFLRGIEQANLKQAARGEATSAKQTQQAARSLGGHRLNAKDRRTLDMSFLHTSKRAEPLGAAGVRPCRLPTALMHHTFDSRAATAVSAAPSAATPRCGGPSQRRPRRKEGACVIFAASSLTWKRGMSSAPQSAPKESSSNRRGPPGEHAQTQDADHQPRRPSESLQPLPTTDRMTGTALLLLLANQTYSAELRGGGGGGRALPAQPLLQPLREL